MCNLNPFATKDRLASKKGFNLVDESNLKLDEPHKDFENVHITPEKTGSKRFYLFMKDRLAREAWSNE